MNLVYYELGPPSAKKLLNSASFSELHKIFQDTNTANHSKVLDP